MSLGPHVGAQSLCACPPSAIKGEACDVTHIRNLKTHLRLTYSYKLTSNTSHSGVGYYAPAARTTLTPCVFLSSSRSSQRSSKTPKPLLILGFRAGALRHPAEDLLSDSLHFWRLMPKGEKVLSPKQKDRTTKKFHQNEVFNWYILNWYLFQLMYFSN
jgi:hypothetical protein